MTPARPAGPGDDDRSRPVAAAPARPEPARPDPAAPAPEDPAHGRPGPAAPAPDGPASGWPAALRRGLRAGPATDPAADLTAALARAEAEGLIDVAYATTDSPVGPLLVAVTDAGLVRVGFAREDEQAALGELAARVSPRVVRSLRRTGEVRRELDEYFAGQRDRFDLPLDWRLARGFRRQVLERLHAEVPYGRTVSYQQLATLVGNPNASRAVGRAMATNPLPIVVPCHRVLRSGGHLGGYGGGLPAKRLLLALERRL